MKKYVFIALCLLLGSCNKVYFHGSTPGKGDKVNQIPEFLEGRFLSVTKSEESIQVAFHRIERLSNDHIKIFTKEMSFADSLTIQSLGLKGIDTAFYNGESVMVSDGDIEKQLNIEDSTSLSPEKLLQEINLKNNFLVSLSDTSRCQLIKESDVFYLNIEADSINYNSVIALDFKNDLLSIWSSTALSLTSEKQIDQLIEDFPIEKKKVNHRGYYTVNYYANLNDQEFFQFTQNHEIFPVHHLHKIDSNEFNWGLWVLIFLISGITIILAFKMIRKKRT